MGKTSGIVLIAIAILIGGCVSGSGPSLSAQKSGCELGRRTLVAAVAVSNETRNANLAILRTAAKLHELTSGLSVGFCPTLHLATGILLSEKAGEEMRQMAIAAIVRNVTLDAETIAMFDGDW